MIHAKILFVTACNLNCRLITFLHAPISVYIAEDIKIIGVDAMFQPILAYHNLYTPKCTVTTLYMYYSIFNTVLASRHT